MTVDSPYEPCTIDSQEVPPSTQGGMILDFPLQPRRRVSSDESMMFDRPNVQISQFSQLVTIPYDDPETKWYTKEEKDCFKRDMLLDVRMLRDLLREETPGLISEEVLNECVGIENLLSSYTAHLVVKKRREHSMAVLSVQREYKGDDHMHEMLAKTSYESSRWARKRAVTLASGYSRKC